MLRLPENNPYATGQIVQFLDGTIALDGNPPKYVLSPFDDTWLVKDGDTLSDIAFEKYKDSKWYFLIQAANHIDCALDITAYIGKLLIIPDLAQYKAFAQ